MSKETLKPCPFCGSTQCFVMADCSKSTGEAVYRIWCCGGCKARGDMHDDRQQAIDSWNRVSEAVAKEQNQ